MFNSRIKKDDYVADMNVYLLCDYTAVAVTVTDYDGLSCRHGGTAVFEQTNCRVTDAATRDTSEAASSRSPACFTLRSLHMYIVLSLADPTLLCVCTVWASNVGMAM